MGQSLPGSFPNLHDVTTLDSQPWASRGHGMAWHRFMLELEVQKGPAWHRFMYCVNARDSVENSADHIACPLQFGYVQPKFTHPPRVLPSAKVCIIGVLLLPKLTQLNRETNQIVLRSGSQDRCDERTRANHRKLLRIVAEQEFHTCLYMSIHVYTCLHLNLL